MERAFLRKKLKSNKSLYARFYLTLKAHKLKPGQTVDNLKSRPIVSCPGSLLHGLGVWVDRKLQEVAQRIVSYFKNTLELKKELLNLHLPRNARLFTADAVSMYTNIPTHTALNLIGKYLDQYQRKHNNDYPKDAVRAGLRLVMTMNIFTFGDLTLKQLNGTAMGSPQHPRMPPYTMEFMKKNSFHTTPNEWYSIKDLLTTSSEYGARITTTNRTHWNGIISKTK